MNDPIGLAIYDYLNTGKEAEIVVNSNYTEDERIPVSWFFREEKKMPRIEKTALKLCRGKILDVGAAAGCHSLVLQKKGLQVTAIEKSGLAAETMKLRGVQNVICTDIFDFYETGFDTILLLMNGSGIGGTMEGLKKLLLHLKSLLSENGQILMDSSDIKYLFEEEDGSFWIDLTNNRYYGEMEYEIFYKNASNSFNWLFIDYETLKKLTGKIGLLAVKIESGKHHNYLAKIEIPKEGK